MAQSINSAPKLTDIPLSLDGDEPGDAKPADEKIDTSKSNSLKRFFKMNSKRIAANGAQQPATDNIEPVEQDVEQSKQTEKPRRFHLRLGGMHRHSGETQSSPSVMTPGHIVEDAQECGSSSSAPVKSGLKSSLSNYWNSVFKRQQFVANRKTSAKPNQDDVDEESENELQEQVHTLAISEECDGATKH